ncbi:acetyl-coenzyme A synthetase N-terminal domain-containing protein, partial [Acinetobacter baumannii]
MSYPYQITSFEAYKEAYQKSIEDPAAFWESIAEHFVWKQKWTSKEQVLNWDFKDP